MKKATQSKTIWFNVVVAIATALSANIDLIHAYLSDGGYMAVMIVISAINTYLRTITKDGIN